jgi:hypothetical protein
MPKWEMMSIGKTNSYSFGNKNSRYSVEAGLFFRLE